MRVVEQWPPGPEFPASAPVEGFRMDRHGYDGFQYKLWLNDGGMESAVYCPARYSSQVAAVLGVVRETVTDASAYPDSTAAVCLDVMVAPDLTFQQIGVGYDPESSRSEPTVDQLRQAAINDIDERLKSG